MVPVNVTGIANRLTCPVCGNDEVFFELANDVLLTSYYIQNSDGSFTHDGDSTQVNGDVLLFCGSCQEDLTQYHQRFREMIF